MTTRRTIPQVRPWLGEDEMLAAAKAVSDNWITEGPRSAEFVDKHNQMMGTSFGVLAPNGTLALVLGLLALDIRPGDEVLVSNITFIASANAVIMVGAIPIFVDVDSTTFQIDVEKASALIGDRTRAIMPVHLYGTACDMDAVKQLASRHNLKVIEDAAQGIGVFRNGEHTGAIGDVGCFSFFADKTVTTGEGGFVVCRDRAIYDRLRLLRNQGRFDRGSFIHTAIGYNFRITDIQSAIGLVQLAKLGQIIAKKQEILAWYMEDLHGLDKVRFLEALPGSDHVPFRCVLMLEGAHELMSFLESSGVQTRGFFYPLHKQPCFADWSRAHGWRQDLSDENFPNSLRGYDTGMCLPIYPELSRMDVRYICDRIHDYFRATW